MLDHSLYPHLVERIAFWAPYELRGASRYWRKRVDASFTHWRIQDPTQEPDPKRDFPDFPAQLVRLGPYPDEVSTARYLDVGSPPDPRWVFPNLEIARYLDGAEGDLRLGAPTVILHGPIASSWQDLHRRRTDRARLQFPETVEHVIMSLGQPVPDSNVWENRIQNLDNFFGGFTPFPDNELWLRPLIKRITVVLRKDAPHVRNKYYFWSIPYRIIRGDLDFTVVCGCCGHDASPTDSLRVDAIKTASAWRDLFEEPTVGASHDWWPSARELLPSDKFNPQAERVRSISYNEWREEVGETLFRLAVGDTA
jgi:hypothetical protein